MCKLKTQRSTAKLGLKTILVNGGYKVQPTPAPPPKDQENINKIKDGGNNQKLKLFKRGKAHIWSTYH